MVSRLSVCLLLVVASLVGCMPTHLGNPSDTYVRHVADTNATANACADAEFLSRHVANEIGAIHTQILRIYKYDNALYEGAYAARKYDLLHKDEIGLYSDCSQIKYSAHLIIKKGRTEYARNLDRLKYKQAAFNQFLSEAVNTTQELGQQAQSMGNNASAYTNLPNNQPSFGLPDNQTNHYLINTDSGLTQCHVTPSGYTFCN